MNNNDPKYNPTFDKLRGDAAAGCGKYGFFTADDGAKLFYEYWAPCDRPPEKVVIGLHGMAAHSRYLSVLADALVPHGVAVAVFDYRCHGLSEGTPGDITKPEPLIADVKKFCEFVRGRLFPGVPIITLGESMGGALNVVLNCDPPEGVRGMVLLAPAIAPSYAFSLQQILLAPLYVLAAVAAPCLRIIKVSGDEARGMRSLLNIKYDQEDPLHLKYASPRFLLSIKSIVDRARREGVAIKTPTLVIQGGKDVAVSPEAVKQFVAQLAAPDKTLKFFPDVPHCMTNDPEVAPRLKQIVRDWVLSH